MEIFYYLESIRGFSAKRNYRGYAHYDNERLNMKQFNKGFFSTYKSDSYHICGCYRDSEYYCKTKIQMILNHLNQLEYLVQKRMKGMMSINIMKN